ncbi:MAG: TetR family transcriptional regulator [Myxococcota bacterium]
MARPVNANAEETKRRILDAASDLFAERGFEGTSVRQIASAANVSLGMIRHYFGSKEGLHRACLESALTAYPTLTEYIETSLASGQSPADVIVAATRIGFRYAVERKGATRLTMWTQMEDGGWRAASGDNMLTFLRDASALLARATGQPQARVALGLRSLVALVTRYAVLDHDEIAYIVGGGVDPAAKADAGTIDALEQHLTDLAPRLIGVAPAACLPRLPHRR